MRASAPHGKKFLSYLCNMVCRGINRDDWVVPGNMYSDAESLALATATRSSPGVHRLIQEHQQALPDQKALAPDAKTVKRHPHKYLPYHFYLYQMLEEARTHAQTAAGPKPKLFRILPQLKMKARCITLGDTALAGLVQRMAEQSTTPLPHRTQSQWKQTLHEPCFSGTLSTNGIKATGTSRR